MYYYFQDTQMIQMMLGDEDRVIDDTLISIINCNLCSIQTNDLPKPSISDLMEHRLTSCLYLAQLQRNVVNKSNSKIGLLSWFLRNVRPFDTPITL